MVSLTDKMALKAFWEAVEQRLAACSADELRALLRQMAQETLPADRRMFLAQLDTGKSADASAVQVIQIEDLLAEIEDLAAELDDAVQSADDWEEPRYEWGEYYNDEDSLGRYETFVSPLSALFDRVGAAFDYGDLALARQAYQRLFELTQTEDDYGRGIHFSDLPDVAEEEAIARYLRAVYETEPFGQRVSVLYTHMQQANTWVFRHRPMLNDLIQISPALLPDQDAFLVDWISYLRMQNPQSGSAAEGWLREAVRLAKGTAGMESLARSEGQMYPRAYLDWFTALAAEGQHQAILDAAREALQVLPSGLPIRAAIADHLCMAAAHLEEAEILRQGRWEAFAAKPSLGRILDLWEVAGELSTRAAWMQRAVEHLREYLARPSESHAAVDWRSDSLERRAIIGRTELTHACLLAGAWAAAHELAAQGKSLGWSSSEKYQGLALAVFLARLSGAALDALPPNLQRVWQWYVFLDNLYWRGEDGGGAQALNPRLERAYAERFTALELSPEQQTELLDWCITVVEQRVAGIVGNQRRKSYDKAAVLTVACAETLRLRGDSAASGALMSMIRNRFPRHSAFQRELKNALRHA